MAASKKTHTRKHIPSETKKNLGGVPCLVRWIAIVVAAVMLLVMFLPLFIGSLN